MLTQPLFEQLRELRCHGNEGRTHMDVDTGLLRQTALFQGMEDGDIRRLLDCLHCPVRRYGRGEFLCRPAAPR